MARERAAPNRNPAVDAAIERMNIDPGAEAWQLEVQRRQQEAPDEEPIEETAADRVQRMLSSSGDDDTARVSLYRLPAPRKYEWCDDYSPAEFEAGGLAMIRKKWGPGSYEIRLYGKRPGTTLFSIRAKEIITIVQSSEPTPGGHAMPSELTALLATLAQQQQQQAETQRAMLEAITNRPVIDPMAQMTQMLQMMALMRQATGANEAPKNNLKEIVEAMREMREVSKEFGPQGDKEESDPLMAMLPGVLDLVKASAQRPVPQAVEFPPVALPAPVEQHQTEERAPDETVNPVEDNDPMSITTLRLHLAVLLDMASKHTVPAEAAEVVYSKAPDEILDMLSYPGWFDLLVRFEPSAAPHKVWLENVSAIVVQIMKEESETISEDESGPETVPAVHREGVQS